VQRAHPGRFAFVKPLDPDDPAVADVIADWKKTPGTVGIRIMMTKEAGRDPNDPGLDRHPDTRFIVDHLAIMQPRTPPAPPQPWADLPKVEPFRQTDRLSDSERAMLMGGACARAYGWSPKKG
jgi:hypothetical protein